MNYIQPELHQVSNALDKQLYITSCYVTELALQDLTHRGEILIAETCEYDTHSTVP